MPPHGTNLTITNPLVLYRSLIATNRIQPDPAQHRLALHLQKLYERLIDYEPTLDYSDRLKELTKAVGSGQNASPVTSDRSIIGARGVWKTLLAQKEKRDSLALTRVLTSHEAALQLQSPKGLMLHGEVGTGKSMLIDLFADCLPNRKKRRWHFNTFMLHTLSRLEHLRKTRPAVPSSGIDTLQDEYSLLWLARDLIEKSPILFLDEFQLPDRAASKILSNLITSFFQLGGVLIATSNRMPEELAKAAGMEFARPVSRLSRLGWRLGMGGVVGKDDGPGQRGEFAQFLEVLRARCEVWEMEGKKDYRRLSSSDETAVKAASSEPDLDPNKPVPIFSSTSAIDKELPTPGSKETVPKHYLIHPSPDTLKTTLHKLTSTPPTQVLPWKPTTLTVYSRPLFIPAHHAGTALFTFSQLCGSPLGPADYITLASTYHTLIILDIPIMTLLQKNEARRLITLLDALYEARCRLLVTASASPDEIFFPTSPASANSDAGDIIEDDATHPETFSEIHQDLTSPFRPNISPTPSLPFDALEDDPPNRVRRPGSSFTDERRQQGPEGSKAPDFANIGGLTGEDEKFAVRRAESRLWEMCSARWWTRGSTSADVESEHDGETPSAGEVLGETSWWRPLPVEARHWERSTASSSVPTPTTTPPAVETVNDGEESTPDEPDARTGQQKDLFAHGASPFRTTSDPPPKIEWTHVWGTVKWGKRAGTWGKGVEGLEERRKKNVSDRDVQDEERREGKAK